MAGNPWSALLIGSCFKTKAGSRAVARRAKDGTERDSANLNGVDADLCNMRRMLIHYPKVDVFDVLLQRRDDNKAILLGHVRDFMSQDKKKYFVLYYSGHGTSEGDWVIRNGRGEEEYISLQELIDHYGGDDGSKMLLIISDCCHSGNWVDQLRRLGRMDIRMMASCEATETCKDTEYGGVFTTKYIETCQKTSWSSINVIGKHLFGHELLGVGCIFLPRVPTSRTDSALLIGNMSGFEWNEVSIGLRNMSQMLTDTAKIDVYDTWLQRRRDRKQDLMDLLRAFFSQEGKRRFVLYYSGHGTTEGDWVFYSNRPDDHTCMEECVTLQEIIGLWDELSKGRCQYRLVIIADSCHSGVWVDKLNELERKDIAMNACEDTSEGGYFTMWYILECKNFFARTKWLESARFLVAKAFFHVFPFIPHHYRGTRIQPVRTDTKSDILPLFDSFTDKTFHNMY